jgi:lysophospholipid acyltransferase (LPLAT)-like uncharacterized protein
MKWRPSPKIAAVVAGPLISLLARSWRVELVEADRWRELAAGSRPFLFLLWHEVLLPLLWHHRRQGVAIVVSEARDGRYLAEYAARIGYRLLFGSSTRGGARALLQAVKALEEGAPVAFTPDGPRGPRRELKPGVIAAAERSGALVLPIHATADRAWRLRSWDRFMIPKPFARVRIGYGAPLEIPPGGARSEDVMNQAAEALRGVEEMIAWPPVAATATV